MIKKVCLNQKNSVPNEITKIKRIKTEINEQNPKNSTQNTNIHLKT